MQNNSDKLQQQIYPSLFKEGETVDVYSDNVDEDYIDAPVLSEDKNTIVDNREYSLQDQLQSRAEIHQGNYYNNSVTNRNIMEQAHADGRRNEYMNQTSAHVRPLDPVYNAYQQNLTTPSNVGPQYNQGTNLSNKREEILGCKRQLSPEDMMSMKGNEGKSYLMTNSSNYNPQECTTHAVVQSQSNSNDLKHSHSHNVNSTQSTL